MKNPQEKINKIPSFCSFLPLPCSLLPPTTIFHTGGWVTSVSGAGGVPHLASRKQQQKNSTIHYSLSERSEKQAGQARRASARMALLLCATLLAAWAHTAHGELLTPPYFNLAEGRRISATATCGDGDNPSELYCKLVGATAEDNQNIIHGQVIIFMCFCLL